MARDRYEPIKLNQMNRYAGYQFPARVNVDRMVWDRYAGGWPRTGPLRVKPKV